MELVSPLALELREVVGSLICFYLLHSQIFFTNPDQVNSLWSVIIKHLALALLP